MSRNLTLPYFPLPPGQYQQQYFDTLIRNFAIYLEQMQQPGEGRATTFVFTNLQNNDQGLEVGGIFNQGGFVKLSALNNPHVGGCVGTSGVGTVTVVT